MAVSTKIQKIMKEIEYLEGRDWLTNDS
jgi:hypothetical protein